jgi:hypothetical protein
MGGRRSAGLEQRPALAVVANLAAGSAGIDASGSIPLCWPRILEIARDLFVRSNWSASVAPRRSYVKATKMWSVIQWPSGVHGFLLGPGCRPPRRNESSSPGD